MIQPISLTLFALFSLLAEDDMGVQSPAFQVSINLCSGCSGHGRCDYDDVLPTENAGSYKAACDCDLGYFGTTLFCYELFPKTSFIDM